MTSTINQPLHQSSLKSYASSVAAQSRQNPCLQNLNNFLQDDTTNRHTCRLMSLEFSSNPESPHRRNLELDSLASLLCRTPRRGDDEVYGTVLFVEDLSSQIIETLGSLFDIDPLFFASHIDTFKTSIATARPSMATLPSTTRSHNFVNLHYHRVIELDNLGSHHILLRDMNVPRKVKLLPQLKGINVGLARHCCSVMNIERKDRPWLGEKILIRKRRFLSLILKSI